jgi:hypothetical protein
MSSEDTNDRKRKPTAEPEAVVSSQDQNHNTRDSKAPRASSDYSVSSVASAHTTALVKTEEFSTTDATSVSDPEQEEPMQSIGAWIQDLFHSDNCKVNAALNALFLNLGNDKEKIDTKRSLKKVTKMKTIPARDQVAKLNELAAVELKTIIKSLWIITILTRTQDLSKVGIIAVGGMEVVAEVMKTLPKCVASQGTACGVLVNLACCNSGKQKAAETGAVEVMLAALKNHLDSAYVCGRACGGLGNILVGSKENARN